MARMMVIDCLALSSRIFKIPKGAILTRKRTRLLSHARQNAMLLARESGNSVGHIARVMGFDHTTVIHGIKSATARRENVLKKLRERTKKCTN